MTILKRYEPKDGDIIEDLLLHQERLLIQRNMLLNFIKDISNRSCCNACECISCDATKLLREIGQTK